MIAFFSGFCRRLLQETVDVVFTRCGIVVEFAGGLRRRCWKNEPFVRAVLLRVRQKTARRAHRVPDYLSKGTLSPAERKQLRVGALRDLAVLACTPDAAVPSFIAEHLNPNSARFRNFRVFVGRLFVEHPCSRSNILHTRKISAYIFAPNKMNYDPRNRNCS